MTILVVIPRYNNNVSRKVVSPVSTIVMQSLLSVMYIVFSIILTLTQHSAHKYGELHLFPHMGLFENKVYCISWSDDTCALMKLFQIIIIYRWACRNYFDIIIVIQIVCAGLMRFYTESAFYGQCRTQHHLLLVC